MSKDKVWFTPQQVELIEQHFPELVGSAQTTEAQLRHTAGQRSVVAFIRSRQAKHQGAPDGVV